MYERFNSLVNIQVKTTGNLEKLDAAVHENQSGQKMLNTNMGILHGDIKDMMVTQSKPTPEVMDLTHQVNALSHTLSQTSKGLDFTNKQMDMINCELETISKKINDDSRGANTQRDTPATTDEFSYHIQQLKRLHRPEELPVDQPLSTGEVTPERQRVAVNRIKKPIEIPQEIRNNYTETLDEFNESTVDLQRMEHSLVKATKQRRKEIKNKIRKTKRIMDLQQDHLEDLTSRYPSLKAEITPHVTVDDKVTEIPETRSRTYSKEDRETHSGPSLKFIRRSDHSIVRKNHWPDDADEKDLIFLDSEDEEVINMPEKQSSSRTTDSTSQRQSRKIDYSSISKEFLEETFAEWKEHCRLNSFRDRSESYHRGLNHKESEKSSKKHFSLNVVNTPKSFQTFIDERLKKAQTPEVPTTSTTSSARKKENGTPPRDPQRDKLSGQGDSFYRQNQTDDSDNNDTNQPRSRHHPRRDDRHTPDGDSNHRDQQRKDSDPDDQRPPTRRNRHRRRDSSEDDDDYDNHRQNRTKYPPPNNFEGLPGDNIQMFIKQYERFAKDKRYDKADYYMNSMKYLSSKVRTLLNRWTQEALADWEQVKSYLVRTYEIRDSRRNSVLEFGNKKQLDNESYRDHMMTLQSLKMTGWPEEFANCKSNDVKEPFNTALMSQFLQTCKNTSIANSVEKLVAEKTAMDTYLTIDNVITYCEYLADSKYAAGKNNRTQTTENCKTCQSPRHTTKECLQPRKVNKIQQQEPESDYDYVESEDDRQGEVHAFDRPQQNQPGPSKPAFNNQKPDFLKKRPFQKFSNGKNPSDGKSNDNGCFHCGRKGHFAPDCKVKDQTTLGFFIQCKYNIEKYLRDLEKRLCTENLSHGEQKILIKETTDQMENLNRTKNYIANIEQLIGEDPESADLNG